MGRLWRGTHVVVVALQVVVVLALLLDLPPQLRDLHLLGDVGVWPSPCPGVAEPHSSPRPPSPPLAVKQWDNPEKNIQLSQLVFLYCFSITTFRRILSNGKAEYT